LHPNLIEFGKFALPSYGVLVATGMVLGLIISVNLCKREGLNEDFAWNVGLSAISSGMIGSKILLVFLDNEYNIWHPASLLQMGFLRSAGVWYGGLVAAVAGGLLYVAYKKMPLLDTLDSFVPGIALGHGIGRLGCFAAGCCYGRETDKPWGVVFTNPLANALVGTPLNVRLHPTQLYESGAEVLLFFVLMWMWRRKQFSGQVFGTYAFLYGIIRFTVEFYRDDPGRGSVFAGAMSTTQLISIFMVILGGLMWLRREPRRLVPV
jgi:phosphatidylglycerol:prolipoprotein diacylglycerol transferase